MKKEKQLTELEAEHIQTQLDWVRSIVRNCSEERMPQGACKYCMELYRTAVNQAIDRGLYE